MVLLGILYGCKGNSTCGSLLAMLRGFKPVGQFVLGSLECAANAADTAQSKENENSNDSTDDRAHGRSPAPRAGRSVGLSLWLSKLEAEGVNISAESFFQISLRSRLRVQGSKKTIAKCFIRVLGDCLIGCCFCILRISSIDSSFANQICSSSIRCVLLSNSLQSFVDCLKNNWRGLCVVCD